MSCFACDPDIFTIYGYCESCGRKCKCPMLDSTLEMPIEDWIEYVIDWQNQPSYI